MHKIREFHEPGFDIFLRSFVRIHRIRKSPQYLVIWQLDNYSLRKSPRFSGKLQQQIAQTNVKILARGIPYTSKQRP